jgi:hypothetical protein
MAVDHDAGVALLARSHALGSDPRVTNCGGGNTSPTRACSTPTTCLGEVTWALGRARGTPPPLVARGVGGSLVAGTATVLDQLGGVGEVHVFGGAGPSSLYRRLGEVTGLPVVAGPVEATAPGNARIQALALGVGP